MKTFKRFACLLIAVLMGISMFACTGSGAGNNSGAGNDSSSEVVDSSSSSTKPAKTTYTFNAEESKITASLGEELAIPELTLEGSDGSSTPATFKVYDSYSNLVDVAEGKITVTDKDGYAIIYKAKGGSKEYSFTLQIAVDYVEAARWLTNKVEKAGRVTLEKNSDCPSDFVLSVEGDEPIKVLQLTDTQMIDPTQIRPGASSSLPARYQDRDKCIYNIVRQVVEKSQPDLILITGDYVYGEYDDNGTLFREQTEFFEELGIYWAPIFGNHDNDSNTQYSKWVDPEYPSWTARSQCEYFEQAPHCIFRMRADLSGYSNYSITVKQGGEVQRSIYMLDTKGSRSSIQEITSTQLNWYNESVAAVNAYTGKTIPSFVCIHVPMYAFSLAAEKYGFVSATQDYSKFLIPADNENGDFGEMYNGMPKLDSGLVAFRTFKNGGTDGIFAGHEHSVNFSIMYDGVRLTMGTKSSLYDTYNSNLLGGTLITLDNSEFKLSIIKYEEA